jgi:hypothetical protein
MIAFAGMLLTHAEKAGMKCPTLDEIDEDNLGTLREPYPHFYVFCLLQLSRRMEWDEPWDNAKVIAAIPEDELKRMTPADFKAKGVRGI